MDVQPKIAKRRFVAAQSRRKATKVGNSLRTKKKKRKGHSKIYDDIKRNLYTWITRHPQVFQSLVSNDSLKYLLYDQTEPQLVPKFLLQVFVRELHNSLVSDSNDSGLKDATDEDGKIIICGCCIYAKSIHSSLLSWRDRYLKNSRIKDKILKAEGLVRKHTTYIQHIKIQ